LGVFSQTALKSIDAMLQIVGKRIMGLPVSMAWDFANLCQERFDLGVTSLVSEHIRVEATLLLDT
jgi:hypothetical protein